MGSGKLSWDYMEYRVMKEMGWSYQELRECPSEVIFNILRYLNTESKFIATKTKDKSR